MVIGTCLDYDSARNDVPKMCGCQRRRNDADRVKSKVVDRAAADRAGTFISEGG